jgi:hypothetical protein
MKTLKNLVLAASIYALTTACGQTNPSPESKVAVTPPTPVTNKCDNVKNPLEDVDWLKEIVKVVKENKTPYRLTQYTYKGQYIYYSEFLSKYCDGFSNCDKSIATSFGGCGAAGYTSAEISLFKDFFINRTNPIILFEQK